MLLGFFGQLPELTNDWVYAIKHCKDASFKRIQHDAAHDTAHDTARLGHEDPLGVITWTWLGGRVLPVKPPNYPLQHSRRQMIWKLLENNVHVHVLDRF